MIIKDKKQQELDYEHKKYWKYPNRSCSMCKKYKCFLGQENTNSDFAKYGCIQFTENE